MYDPIEYWNDRAKKRPDEWDRRNDLIPLADWCRETFDIVIFLGNIGGSALRKPRLALNHGMVKICHMRMRCLIWW